MSGLLSANDDKNLSKGEVKLSDSELIGNIFIILVAGHEVLHPFDTFASFEDVHTDEGSRGCVGRKFSETEGAAVLTI